MKKMIIISNFIFACKYFYEFHSIFYLHLLIFDFNLSDCDFNTAEKQRTRHLMYSTGSMTHLAG